MTDQHLQGRVGGASWTIAEIAYEAIDHDLIRNRLDLFYIITAASFIEITSDLYTSCLISFYRGDEEIADWLANYWEHEEVQHGAALRRYVQTVWPSFDWDRAYRGFSDEYSRLCNVESLAPSRSLEMVARCVVETGTATFYRTLSEIAPEPVLRQITANISADEVRHYKYFYRFFQHYRKRERPSRLAVLRQLWLRSVGVNSEDAPIAFKHVFQVANPEATFTDKEYDRFRASIRSLGHKSFPYHMAVKMLLKPLGLSPPVGRVLEPTLEYTTRFLFSR